MMAVFIKILVVLGVILMWGVWYMLVDVIVKMPYPSTKLGKVISVILLLPPPILATINVVWTWYNFKI